jgi:hypothetical protein
MGQTVKLAKKLRNLSRRLEVLAEELEEQGVLLAAQESTVEDTDGEELTIYRVDLFNTTDYGIRVVGKDDVELLASWLGVEVSFDDEGE